jgi:ABC-type glycerol-3-phosphate transport system substrate-binding protein
MTGWGTATIGRAGFAALIGLTAVGGAAAAMQTPAAMPAATPTTALAPAEITFWTTAEEGYPEWEAAFEAANPGVVVASQYIGNYDEMAQRVQAAIAGGDVPNVAQMGQRHGLPQVIDAGALVPVADYLTEPDVADIRPGLWSRFTYKGEQWVVPFASSTPGMWFHADAFREAGLDPANPPQTWEDVAAAAEALTVDEDGDGQPERWGFSTCGDVPWYVRPMILQAGGQLYDETGAPQVNGEAGVAALSFFRDIVHERGAAAPVGHQTGEDDFKAGTVGILFCSTANRGDFAESIGDRFAYGLAWLPEREERAVGLGGAGLVVFQGDPAEQAAAEAFVRFLTDTRRTAEMGEQTGYVAIRESAMSEPEIQALLAEDAYARTIYDQLPFVADAGINPADAILWGGLLNAVETVQTDPEADPQQLLDDLQREMEDYLATYE